MKVCKIFDNLDMANEFLTGLTDRIFNHEIDKIQRSIKIQSKPIKDGTVKVIIRGKNIDLQQLNII